MDVLRLNLQAEEAGEAGVPAECFKTSAFFAAAVVSVQQQ